MSETTIHPSSESGANPLVHIPESTHVVSPESGTVEVTNSVIQRESQYPPLPEKSFRSELVKYLISFVILAAGVGSMFGLLLLKEPPKEFESKELVPMVRITKAMNFNGQLDKVISGTVVPYREIKVAAEINGIVAKKYDEFEAGNFVKKGTKLIEIDKEDYQLQLQTGLAEVEQSQKLLEESQEEIAGAKRNIQLSRNEYTLAQSDHQRNIRIQNALSSSELDQSKRSLLAAETALTTRKNALDMLNAKVERLKSLLGAYQSPASTYQIESNQDIHCRT